MAHNTKQFGEHLRGLRKARDMSQSQLGEMAGMNDKYLGELERGDGNPSLDVLDRLAKALEIDLATLVGDEVTRMDRAQARTEAIQRVDAMSDDQLRDFVRLLRLSRR